MVTSEPKRELTLASSEVDETPLFFSLKDFSDKQADQSTCRRSGKLSPEQQLRLVLRSWLARRCENFLARQSNFLPSLSAQSSESPCRRTELSSLHQAAMVVTGKLGSMGTKPNGKSSKARKKSKNDTLLKEDEHLVGNSTETGSRKKGHCISSVDEDCTREIKGKSSKAKKKSKNDTVLKEDEHLVGNNTETGSRKKAHCISSVDEDCPREIKGKSSKAKKKSKNDTLFKEDEHLVGNNTETGSRKKAHCISSVDEDCPREIKGKSSKAKKKSKHNTLLKEDEHLVGNNTETGSRRKAHCISSVDEGCTREIKRKSKKDGKKIKKEHLSKEVEHIVENTNEATEDEVYCISSGDEDCSKGMKKWITEYHQARHGLKVLQQRIDDFIVAHEARLDQERKEKEARLAEGGWTVVVHQKGRKKTTELESGTTVGSVAQAAVEDKLGKKKRQEIGPNFYRFQRKEAQRNELLMLQSKFEQDKKRIQQMRATRKFRPY